MRSCRLEDGAHLPPQRRCLRVRSRVRRVFEIRVKSRGRAEDGGHAADGVCRVFNGESVVGMACRRPPEKR